MTAVVVVAPAVRAIDLVIAELEAAGIVANRDAGAFYPQPVGVLVGLPSLISRGLFSRTFEVAILVVSGDPLNSTPTVDRVYSLADEVATALDAAEYRTSAWRKGPNAEPLPAVEVAAVVTVTELEQEV